MKYAVFISYGRREVIHVEANDADGAKELVLNGEFEPQQIVSSDDECPQIDSVEQV